MEEAVLVTGQATMTVTALSLLLGREGRQMCSSTPIVFIPESGLAG